MAKLAWSSGRQTIGADGLLLLIVDVDCGLWLWTTIVEFSGCAKSKLEKLPLGFNGLHVEAHCKLGLILIGLKLSPIV